MSPSKSKIKVSAEWVWSASSNVHVTNDRNWFETFTEFTSYAMCQQSADLSSILKVSGVGTVHLPVRRSRHGKSQGCMNIWVLEDVLYVPGFPFNVVGGPLPGFTAYFREEPTENVAGHVLDERGIQFAYFQAEQTFALPVFALYPTHRPLAKHDLSKYCDTKGNRKKSPTEITTPQFSVTWRDAERDRWETPGLVVEMNRTIEVSAAEPFALPEAAPPVAQPVKKSVAKPVKQSVAQPVKQSVTQPVKQPVAQPVAQSVEEPLALPAPLFTKEQLAYIRRDWGDPSAFMGCYGLAWSNKKHRPIAQETVKALMKEAEAAEKKAAAAPPTTLQDLQEALPALPPALPAPPRTPKKGLTPSSTVATVMSDITNVWTDTPPERHRRSPTDLLMLDEY